MHDLSYLENPLQSRGYIGLPDEHHHRVLDALAHLPVGILLLDVDGRLLSVNSAAQRFLGYGPEELRGRPFFAFCHPDDRASYLDRYAALVSGTVPSYSREGRYLRKGGGIVWGALSASLVRPSRSRSAYTLCLLEDISARKMAEAASHHERILTACILDTIDCLIIVTDRAGRILRFNHACETLSGHTLDETRGIPFWELFFVPQELPQVLGTFAELCVGHFPIERESHCRSRDMHERLIAWTITAMLDPLGRVEYIVATGLDITERAQAEAAVRRFESGLSPTELKVLPLLARPDMANYRQIGTLLHIDRETVRDHMQSIARKLGVVAHRSVVVAAARERDLI
jgi:PAS domain S-box-containing protein